MKTGLEQRSAGRIAMWTHAWIMVLFLLAPIAVIVIVSFGNSTYMEFPPKAWSLRWYREFFGSPRWIGSSLLSIQVALLTTVASTILGTSAAIGIVRGRGKGKRAIDTFLVSPLVTPSIVLAVGLYFLFSPLHLVDTALGIILGHIVIATPLVFIIVSAALRTSDASLELAARSLGAGAFSCLWRITLPIIRPAIVSGAAFAFLTSFDEVVIATFLGGPHATTLPKRMWESVRFETDPTLTAIATILVLLTFVILGVAELSRRLATKG